MGAAMICESHLCETAPNQKALVIQDYLFFPPQGKYLYLLHDFILIARVRGCRREKTTDFK